MLQNAEGSPEASVAVGRMLSGQYCDSIIDDGDEGPELAQANIGRAGCGAGPDAGMRDEAWTANYRADGTQAGEDERLRVCPADADNHFNQTFQRPHVIPAVGSPDERRPEAALRAAEGEAPDATLSRLPKDKVAAAVADPANVDKAGLAAANKEIADIDSQLDRISTVGTGQPSGGAPSAPGSHPGAPAS